MPVHVDAQFEIPVWAEHETEVTGFISQFICGYYPTEYDPHWGEGYRKLVKIDKKWYMFSILEALQHGYHTLFEHTVKGAHAAIVMFSINRAGSFDAAKDHVRKVKHVRTEAGLDPIPIALVGNRTSVKGQRVVTVEEVEVFRRTGSCEIIAECFASHDDPSVIDKIFFDLGRAILNRPGKDRPKQKDSKLRPGEEVAMTGFRKRLAHKIKPIFGR
ncbi:uncharacterized protein Z518_09636 [Rhinocladiella mackenziei CBS 650.93]|uniref:Uncharacterized protein n=1 Tax=Rhinocladiella mackenziei CBS 650.93 TaxID=1442369 RepID=A0A0D2IBA5_9EURO|nr:uncharacterized protein Z518_09636 [Rhinocladiella mackenziei CBS 650.93]KIX00571.1 hypothetical protein Z518_09636 [Rhinocladiella mackenziei CBS 650.93]